MFAVALAVGAVASQAASIGLLLPAAQAIDDPNGSTPGGYLGKAIDWALSVIGLPHSVLGLFVGVIVMVTVSAVLLYAHEYISIRMAVGLVADLRRAAFRALLHARMPFHYAYRSGTLISIIVQDGNRAEACLVAMRDVLIRSVMIVMYGMLLLLLSWQTALLAFGVLLLVSGLTQFWVRASSRTGEEISVANADLVNFGTERIHGVREVKLANSEDRDSDRLDATINALADGHSKLNYRVSQLRLATEPLLVASALLIVYVGLKLIGLSLGEVAVFIYALMRMAPEVRGMNAGRYRISGHIATVHSLLDLIAGAGREAESTVSDHQVSTASSRPFSNLSRAITFEEVVFAYDSKSPVLSNINFEITAGETTAIVGPSGEGKSTILSLLVRLLSPTGGRILLDGVPIEEYDLRSLRTGIALVSQDSAIFYDSVLENIRSGYPSATLEEVEKVARLANANEFIEETPNGYDTITGDRGLAISVGQRQRLALARALLPNPSVLLLDEVTSAQDPASERLLQDALWRAKSGRTVVIVSHRLSSIRGVDRVLVLQGGKFVEDGPPKELLKAKGLFRQYYDLQFGSGVEKSRAEIM